MRRPALIAAACVATMGALAAPASASFEQVYADFKDDGVIDACRYSDGELANVQAPGDVEQYAPAFLDALAAAREKRASGGCDPKPAMQPETEPEPEAAQPAPAAPTPRPRPRRRPPAEVPDPPAPARSAPVRVIGESVKAPPAAPALAASRGADAPAPVWLLAALAALTAAAGLTGLAAWWRGWDVGRLTRPLAASAADAGGRTADLAAEFRDWLRLGR